MHPYYYYIKALNNLLLPIEKKKKLRLTSVLGPAFILLTNFILHALWHLIPPIICTKNNTKTQLPDNIAWHSEGKKNLNIVLIFKHSSWNNIFHFWSWQAKNQQHLKTLLKWYRRQPQIQKYQKIFCVKSAIVLKLQSINQTGCKNGIKQDASHDVRKQLLREQKILGPFAFVLHYVVSTVKQWSTN